MQKKPLIRLFNYAKGYRPRVIAASTFSVLNQLFDIAPEILIGVAIDVVVRQENSFLADFGIVDPKNQIVILAALTLAIWILESITEYCYRLLWRNLAQGIQHDLRIDTYAHVQKLDMAYFEDQSTGGLVAIMNDDVNQLERFLNDGASSLIQMATTVISIGTVFFFISPAIAGLAFMPIPVIILGAFFFQKRIGPLYADVREKVGDISARLSNNVSGIATIKSFTAEDSELEKLERASRAYLESNSHAIRVSSAFTPIIRMAILAGFICTLVLGGFFVVDGRLNVGLYGVLIFLTQRLLWPLTRLAETVDLYERAMASTRRILNLLETPYRTRDIETDRDGRGAGTSQGASLQGASLKVRGDLAFEKVSFRYPSSVGWVLSDIGFEVPSGQTVAFVGPTGSGKTSLMKLLLRFYEPQEGRILLDRRPLADWPLRTLRSQVGLVSQDVFLFHGTVLENIRYGRPDANLEEVQEAARMAEAHEFIMALAFGYETVIGERGQKLSGGQRQRLSIARAILKDPPVIILDEATSAVDNETEAAIQRSLARLAVGRTTLVIAHRLSTIVNSSCIYVIDQGKITEHGTHQELLQRRGLYHSLWQVQTGSLTVVEAQA
jgi:ATP-binding cassette, subfamily B, bacterial